MITTENIDSVHPGECILEGVCWRRALRGRFFYMLMLYLPCCGLPACFYDNHHLIPAVCRKAAKYGRKLAAKLLYACFIIYSWVSSVTVCAGETNKTSLLQKTSGHSSVELHWVRFLGMINSRLILLYTVESEATASPLNTYFLSFLMCLHQEADNRVI